MDTVNTTSKKGWKVLELVIFWWITWPVITWALTCYWFITWNDKLECYLFIFIWLPWIFPVQFGTMKPNKASAGLWNHEKNVPFGRIKPELWEKWVNWLQLTLAKSVSLGKPNLRLFMTWQYCFAKFCPWVFGSCFRFVSSCFTPANDLADPTKISLLTPAWPVGLCQNHPVYQSGPLSIRLAQGFSLGQD